jgi:hypothetical protein
MDRGDKSIKLKAFYVGLQLHICSTGMISKSVIVRSIALQKRGQYNCVQHQRCRQQLFYTHTHPAAQEY